MSETRFSLYRLGALSRRKKEERRGERRSCRPELFLFMLVAPLGGSVPIEYQRGDHGSREAEEGGDDHHYLVYPEKLQEGSGDDSRRRDHRKRTADK
jgi:hypothetical protein